MLNYGHYIKQILMIAVQMYLGTKSIEQWSIIQQHKSTIMPVIDMKSNSFSISLSQDCA